MNIAGVFHFLAAPALLAAAVASAEPLPDPVERVIAEAEARVEPEQRWAFTHTYRRNDETVVARYDPRRPVGEQWRLTTPSTEAALTREQREMFADMQAELGPTPDRAVMYTPSADYRFRDLFGGDLTLIDDGPHGRRYAFPFPEELPTTGGDDEFKLLAKHVNCEIAIPANEPWLFSMRLVAPEPFRVGVVVRATKFENTTQYGEVEPGGPIAALHNDNHQVGSILLIPLDDRRVTINSDFERVEALE
jgi:hypothetical protein